MNKTTIGSLVIVAFFAGAALVALSEERPDMRVTINEPGAGWTSSHEYPPPEDTPIVGYWVIKGRRIIFEAECIGGLWYDCPDGAVVFDIPPIEWIGGPGR